jgi:hypothetical protein
MVSQCCFNSFISFQEGGGLSFQLSESHRISHPVNNLGIFCPFPVCFAMSAVLIDSGGSTLYIRRISPCLDMKHKCFPQVDHFVLDFVTDFFLLCRSTDFFPSDFWVLCCTSESFSHSKIVDYFVCLFLILLLSFPAYRYIVSLKLFQSSRMYFGIKCGL